MDNIQVLILFRNNVIVVALRFVHPGTAFGKHKGLYYDE